MRPQWMSMSTIEHIADDFRKQLIEYLRTNQEFGFNNELYLDFLVSSGKLNSFSYTNEDGMSEEILGKYSVVSNEISIYNGIKHKGRENFTVAHEVGHCILHAPLFLPYISNHQSSIPDMQKSFLLHRDSVDHKSKKIATKEIDAFEIQANNFARLLLMPRKHFEELFFELMDTIDLSFGHFKDFSNPNTRKDSRKFYEINSELAHVFETSPRACAIQLQHLGLLDKSSNFNYHPY